MKRSRWAASALCHRKNEAGVWTAAPGVGGASYAYVTPHVSGVLTPWTNAEWTLSVERSVSQPAAAQFASFMGVADRPADISFQPDHGWSYSAVLKQTLTGHFTITGQRELLK